MSDHRARGIRASVAVLSLALPVVLANCSGLGDDSQGDAGASRETAAADPGSAPTVAFNVRRGARGVPVDTRVQVEASDGELRKVDIVSSAGKVPGEIAPGGTAFTAAGLLEPGTAYKVRAVAVGADGEQTVARTAFTTAELSLDQQTFASVAPLDGETVGVGMPVVVSFDVPVRDRAAFERHMEVESTPAQPGSWRWLSDSEAHWRPKAYWKPGTRVSVDIDVNSVPAGGGVYGQESRSVTFEVGDAHVYRVNARTHRMKVFENGRLLRDLPVTTGKPGFTTRSGTKVIMEMSESRRMRSETVGIAADSSEGYDLDDVRWAMRLTTSGEFIHAAPWSVGAQGNSNVSHGCTGLSTADAGWLFAMSRRGDVVEYTGTDRPMTLDNGYGDWNASFREYRKGSALA